MGNNLARQLIADHLVEGEMRRGEEFVMDEVRARARERVRWLVAAGLLALALIVAPLPWRRLWQRAEA